MDRTSIYEPLSDARQIRLLRLSPGRSFTDPLDCRLHVEVLDQGEGDEILPYIALSYVWGAQKIKVSKSKPPPPTPPQQQQHQQQQQQHINCEGVYIPITWNLDLALRSLRENRLAEEHYLWVDSICINQSDLRERSLQISLISDIYRRAQYTVIWLGPGEAPDVPPLLKWKRPQLRAAAAAAAPATATAVCSGSGGKSFQRKEVFSWKGLDFSNNPLFTRLWVFQELLFSSRIVAFQRNTVLEWGSLGEILQMTAINKARDGAFDSDIMRASMFHNLTSNKKFTDLLLAADSGSFMGRIETNRSLAKELSLEIKKILGFSQSLRCSDPRDRIYILLGFLRRVGIDLKPDYSLSSTEVFARAYNATLRFSGYYRDEIPRAPSEYDPVTDDTESQDDECKPEEVLNWACSVGESRPDSPGLYSPLVDKKHALVPFVADYRATIKSILDNKNQKLKRRAWRMLCNELTTLFQGRGPHTTTGVGVSGCGVSLSGSTPVGSEIANNHIDLSHASKLSKKRTIKGDDSDDEDKEHHPKKSRRPSDPMDNHRLLACPYYQRDSMGPGIKQACRGPGFRDVSRLKEHLYRSHYQHRCQRCGEVCANARALDQHHQQVVSCELRLWQQETDPSEGFGREKRDEIKRRCTSSWAQIYRILFPCDSTIAMPSPYYDCNVTFISVISQLERHYERETTRLLAERLQPILGTLSDRLGTAIWQEITQAVNMASAAAIQSFQQTLPGAVASPAATVESRPTAVNEAGTGDIGAPGLMPDEMQSFQAEIGSMLLEYVEDASIASAQRDSGLPWREMMNGHEGMVSPSGMFDWGAIPMPEDVGAVSSDNDDTFVILGRPRPGASGRES
ncbi:uncharacterized protein E0L32_011182 [Thyridium curvatum]|uniref:Heterokaryon incompatibility domain-containing protein n=1 Tax=Thyridium curvatum TaxID=1093900 RepID=A0A507BNI2_9PEZI|nr:uncharacterized protein E0L32_011182 [Thyridium curvatum]TPX19109.1 hypothetical protein E0L32_011182 [Thyridium curvatum]